MNHPLSAPLRLSATAAAVLLGCVACGGSGSGPISGKAVSHKSPAAVTSPSANRAGRGSGNGSGGGGGGGSVGSASAFCAFARQVGKSNLGISEGNLNPDPKQLLGQVDRLDALAPASLKRDFDAYASFEHAVLDPGGSAPTTVPSNATAALEHVATYLGGVCGIR